MNKPGTEVDDLLGGVAGTKKNTWNFTCQIFLEKPGFFVACSLHFLGGSIMCGVLRIGDRIEVRPGIVTQDSDRNVKCRPIFSTIVSLFAEQNDLQYAVPGGLIGMQNKKENAVAKKHRRKSRTVTVRDVLPKKMREFTAYAF